MISENAVVIGGAVALALFGAWDWAGRIYQAYQYDDTTPFVETLAVKPEHVTLRAGETIINRYHYTKRPGCRGRVTYRLIGHPDGASGDTPVTDIPIADFVAGWPSGGPQWRTSKATIPAYVPPGTYQLIWIASAPECDAVGTTKATTPGHLLESRSLPMRVTVKPGASQ